MARVLVLTYHEITEDARIMRQAKALASAGHDVTVLSDLEGSDSEIEQMDGFKVIRFRCLDLTPAVEGSMPSLKFLANTKNAVLADLRRYGSAMRRLRRLERADNVLASHVWRSNAGERPNPAIGTVQQLRNSGIRVARKLVRVSKVFTKRTLNKRSPDRLFHSQHLTALVYAINASKIAVARPDIIHAHDIYTLPAALTLAERFSARVIYDAHEYEPARAQRFDDAARKLSDAFELECLQSVDAVVSVSPSICALYAERFPGPYPSLIMNVPELVAERDDSEVSVRELAGLPEDTPLVVFTGNVLRENRGLDKVLEALRQLDGFHLVVLGPRHERNDLWLTSIAERLEVRSRLHLLPPVLAIDVPRTIKSADLAVCLIQDASLSYRYAMPNKLFEAAFCGIPICVSDLPDMRSFVEELGIGRAVDQTDPTSIADGIRELYRNAKAYRATEEASRQLAERYGWPVQVGRLLGLYESLSRSGSPARAVGA